ncbi:NADPH oxidase activator 1 isoform X3 [Pezoporus occidentalis]|uniref:NADPH oxidase activator 1 isoform X3 n=1 Tax=Pezoporus occidentalis TaxID=407982 RepID=UPI002F9196F6
MAYRELVRRWHQGVLAADGGDWDTALDIFAGIPGPPARICFNMGCVHLLAGRPEAALRAFNDTIAKDSSLAVGFFQRGFVHLQLGRYEEALCDYHMAFSHLRKNPFIDYKQLGLRHILYAWEVLYSTAAAQCQLQRWQEARVTLDKAVVWRPEGRTAILDLAFQQVQVISSIIPNDEYIGFEPLRPQKQGFYEPGADALLESESGYYRVLSHYYPKDSEKLAVRASSLVFVLTRGGDGWATAIHDGQKLRIPSSLLEPASKMDKWKINDGIPLPPAQVPPSRLHMKQKPESAGVENAPVNGAGAQMDYKQIPVTCGDASPSNARPMVLRVCCECTMMLRAGTAPALQDLRALLRECLGQQAQRGRLSYKNSDGKELGAVSGEEDLGRMWQQLTDGRLVLCCQDSESHSGRPILYRMLAQHSYPAQGPGDLDFSKGDVLDVLSEVNEDWLEGHCNGKTGIFPKCFATQTSCGAAFL